MANDLSTAINVILARSLPALRQNAVMASLVNRDFDQDPGVKGSTVQIPIPAAVSSGSVTPGPYPPANDNQTPTSVSIAVSNWKYAKFEMSDKDMQQVFDAEDFIPKQATQAVKTLANLVDVDILSKAAGIYGTAGTSGTTPFQTDLLAFNQAFKVVTNQLAPRGNGEPWNMVINADAEMYAKGLAMVTAANFRGSTDTIREGMIGHLGGADWGVDQNVSTHTTVAAGTPLLDDTVARAVGLKVLHMDGFTVKPTAGDIFTIAGDTQTYVVASATTLVGTDSDVTFEPGLAVAIPAADGNEVVTFKASYVDNLLFHQDAFGLVSRPLQNASFGGIVENQSTIIDPVSKLVLRLQVVREWMQVSFVYDILWGSALIRPEFGCHILG